ncbi:LysE family translocator [Paenarthrobacter sp. Z7-10]|uniref:LysE family translocator n=1 Tax=Paenarthrobacter sp. Z7-10 TaxID=2787635 RepID=UPI0022A9F3C4|nr:LysE family translocator [Paenarthrobacter sp. Z7-10]MCZ2402889.1 LysE family translocator [Paenarthrobacter sp. Z7-10]
MTFASLLAFAGLCLLLSLTPGPDTFLVLRIALNRVGAGLAAAAGRALAGLMWAALVGAGLAAVLEQSALIFRWLKIAGGLYLLYLGISTFLRSRRDGIRRQSSSTAAHDDVASEERAGTAGSPAGRATPRYGTMAGFWAGAVSTLLNPKVGLFYLAVVPQFIPHGGNTLATALVLGCIESGIGFSYLAAVAIVAAKAMGWLRKPKVSSVMERASSAILAALGLGVLASGASS